MKLRFIHSSIHSFIHSLIQPFSIPSFHSRPLARSLANPLLLILISVSQLRKGLVNFLRSLHSTVAALHCTALLFFASFPLSFALLCFALLLVVVPSSRALVLSSFCSARGREEKDDQEEEEKKKEEEEEHEQGKKKTKRNRSESFSCFFCCVVGGGHPCLGCQAPTTA